MRTVLILFVVLLTLTSANSANADERRLALVISQSDYASGLSRVSSASRESSVVGAALDFANFEVRYEYNLNKQELDDVLDDFRISLELAGPEAVGFIYYTGHGAQHPSTGDSYLLGIDAKLRVASDYARYGVDMASQRDGFAATGAKAVFLVFDACRNTPPISGYKSGVKGLSRVAPKADMLIAYSTSLGDVAEEGVYAPVLAEELRRGGQTAEAAFAAAQRRVASDTDRVQLPWTDNLLYNEVCFIDCAVTNSYESRIEQERFDILLPGGDTYQIQNKAKELLQTEVKQMVPDACFDRSCFDPNEFNNYVGIDVEFVIRFGTDKFAVVLSTDYTHNKDNNCHACAGYGSVYIFDSDTADEAKLAFPHFTHGGTFGAPPSYELKAGLTPYPSMILDGGGTWQGCTSGWSSIVEITPSGPVDRGGLTTLYYPGHMANYFEGSKEELEAQMAKAGFGATILSTETPNSFDVVYKFHDGREKTIPFVLTEQKYQPKDGRKALGGC